MSMLDNKALSVIKDFSYKNSLKDDIHGFIHVERVYDLCLKIGKEVNANLLVLQVAALLHDIGRFHEKNEIDKTNHAELSAEMTLKFLQSKQFIITDRDIENIVHSIKAHSFSNIVIPESLEAKVLSDSDKLDVLGAIGLCRTIGFTVKNQGEIDQVIEHLENKILKLMDLLFLEISRQMAEERQQIIIDFYNKIKKERLINFK